MLTYSVVPKKSTIKLHMINPWLKFYMSCCWNNYLLYILDKKVESRKSKLLLLHVLNFEIIWNPHNNFEIVGLTVLHSRHWVKLTTRSRDEFSRENKSWLHTGVYLTVNAESLRDLQDVHDKHWSWNIKNRSLSVNRSNNNSH